MEITKIKLAGMIDHTLLNPAATSKDIITLCAEAREYNFAAVCVNPYWVSLAAEQLAGSGVAVCSVIGFPLGATSTADKVGEAGQAVQNGALEVDMVINIGALKERCTDIVLNEIRAVVEASRAQNPDAVTKVIIETCYLNREQKILACQLAARAGARFVKTSTGFGPEGAAVEDVALMRAIVRPEMGVKASGGIKTAGQALAMIRAGASRIGAGAGVNIIKEMNK